MKRTGRYLRALAALLAAVLLTAAIPAVKTEAAALVTVTSAVIAGGEVVVQTSGQTTSDDGILHLYAQQPYEAGVQGVEVAQAAAGVNAAFRFPLNKNTPASNLYKKFTVVAIRGGVPTPVSNAMYIMNPEACAPRFAARRDGSKKGLLPEQGASNPSLLTNMGVHQIIWNLPVGNLCSGGGINYNYNGKVYSFNSAIVGQYDNLVPKMNAAGIQVTLVVLNNLTGDQTLIHPLSRGHGGANYYMFNAADPAGVERLAAVASFLGQRYSGAVGTVDNWIFGNEVNARQEWNYMSAGAGLVGFTAEYAKAFRVFYNGIKSENGNARVYTCIDQEWAVGDSAAHYGGMPFLVQFNAEIATTGNIDWHVACHPYNVPLYDPIAGRPGALHPHSQAARYITMENIDVLTDFLCTPAMISPTGQVRSVLCSEVGYTSSQGEQLQAASIVYGYQQAVHNQHIDGFILSREHDMAAEIGQGLAFGLTGLNGAPKLAYTWYASAESANTIAAASAILGANIGSLITVR
ncbi:MAG: hypothetical protein IJI62_07060 [Lachnospiraceae bacterium]|nr:hypothetical protein [Lachnospiraceae bacterium]